VPGLFLTKAAMVGMMGVSTPSMRSELICILKTSCVERWLSSRSQVMRHYVRFGHRRLESAVHLEQLGFACLA
jgi:hypothetical protein